MSVSDRWIACYFLNGLFPPPGTFPFAIKEKQFHNSTMHPCAALVEPPLAGPIEACGSLNPLLAEPVEACPGTWHVTPTCPGIKVATEMGYQGDPRVSTFAHNSHRTIKPGSPGAKGGRLPAYR